MSGVGRRRGLAIVVVAALAAVLCAGSAGARQARTASVYTGYGFDTCSAPSVTTLNTWLASPYRALGIYIGGVNRACGDGNLSATWISTVTAAGWSLLPLYVGLQAPCVSQTKLAKLTATGAASQGLAAAQDAVGRAAAFGLPPGTPIYFDMEGYATNNASCSAAVKTFLTNWIAGLHAVGYVAGVYGSAASTIRDLAALGTATADDAWIGDWNGQSSVFGDPYVSDTLWPNHQRIHQYKGGHKETYGGVTLNIDNDFVDGAVFGAAAPPPPPPPPVPAPTPGAPAGSVGSGDGVANVSWPAGAFSTAVVVTLTPQPATAGYTVQLGVANAATAAPTTSFAQPLTLHVAPQPPNLVPEYSTDGVTWKALPRLTSTTLPVGVRAGYVWEPDGSVHIETTVAGVFSLAADKTPPTAPADVRAHFSHGALVLGWHGSTDAGGGVETYRVTLTNNPLTTVPAPTRTATVHAFHPTAPSVYRIVAVDTAGNESRPSKPIVVLPTKRPEDLPRAIPAWAWQLYTWQHGRRGPRPARAPRVPPAWYWHWAGWRSAPFHLRA